jgi:aspartate/methionine/tyrosine aminotransferase
MSSERRGLTERSTLTEWEWVGLQQVWNLADGHSHFRMSFDGDSPLAQMPLLFESIDPRMQEGYERRFLGELFGASRQTPPALPSHLHYSCSTTIDMASKTLQASGISTVGVLTPTFDNIAQLAQRAGLRLVPILERELCPVDDQRPVWWDSCDALFLVLPNNPTGWEPNRDHLENLLTSMAKDRKAVVIDFSFRFYSELHSWDQYAFVAGLPALDWIFIEDTGKTWPLCEMKIGVASSSARFHDTMAEVTGELLLNVSPFVLELLTRTIRADRRNGTGSAEVLMARRLVSENRFRLRSCIGGLGIELPCPSSKISVEWLRFNDRTAVDAVSHLLESGVAVLPGGPFLWQERDLGMSYFRVALARDVDYFAHAIDTLVQCIGEPGTRYWNGRT